MSGSFRETFSEFWAGTVSKIGILFLIIVIIISIFTVVTMPLDYGPRFWSNPKYWVDNPKAAMPVWTNLLSNQYLTHSIVQTNLPSSYFKTLGGDWFKLYNMTYNLKIDQFPTFFTVRMSNVKFYEKPPTLKIFIQRPDGSSFQLFRVAIDQPPENEEPPYLRYDSEPRRILVTGNPDIGASLSKFLMDKYEMSLLPSEIIDIGYVNIIFGERVGDEFQPLKGNYDFSIEMVSNSVEDEIGEVSFVVGGQVYGLIGTDVLGRNLSQGLLFGFPVALLIGFITSVITTGIGASLGIASGYLGGKVDEVIQRFADIVNNIPFLPLLIFLTFVFGGNIWIIVVVLIAFGWPNLVIVVRSMILQIKSSSFVEAAKSLGASKWRIMARHIFPHVAPFILSQMIFYTPSAILSEAALSFLGLGDPSIPTWGQILEYGFNNSAVYLGYWWWIMPPGLLIVFSAITFVLIALGLEPVVNPRLRRWR
jgi:peptide/nickel transport system permease protein